VFGVLGPALGRPIRIHSAPPALHPDQTVRTTEAGKIADVDRRHSCTPRAPHSRTAGDVIGGLNRDPRLGRGLGDLEDPKPRSRTASGAPVASFIVRGYSSLQSSNNSNDIGTPGRVGGPFRSSYFLLGHEEPVMLGPMPRERADLLDVAGD
jgi:hypothetical protein